MCGRFALYAPAEVIKEQFSLDELFEIEPRYNIAPTEELLALSQIEGLGLRPLMFHWGLIPSWAEDKKIASRLINARAETVREKQAFSQAFKKRRCIIVMSGFFEWQQSGNKKQPYFIQSQDKKLLAVAGLWEDWQSQSGENIKSCCLLTRKANDFIRPVHDRMPVMLDTFQQEVWLNHLAGEKELQEILNQNPELELTSYPVTSKMNFAGYKQKEAIEPISIT